MRILIAGGGSGGHLFPAIALAEAFMEKEPINQVRFVTTARTLDTRILSDRGFSAQTLELGGFKGKTMTEKIRSVSKLPGALRQSLALLKEIRPRIVLGVGGYISGPVVLAARLKRIPCVIQEQNSIPGITNRLLGRVADRVFCAFEASRAYFPREKCVLTGNPIRKELQKAAAGKTARSQALTLLILGGSQGAQRINQVMVEALDELLSLKEDVIFIHQTGAKDEPRVAQAYREKGFRHQVMAFITDMTWAYGQADLIISRAGAMTLTEITALGKASLLIPYPYAANNHQEYNARALVGAKAAEMILEKNLTPQLLGETIRDWLKHPERWASLGDQARTLGRWQAADEIVESCYQLLKDKESRT